MEPILWMYFITFFEMNKMKFINLGVINDLYTAIYFEVLREFGNCGRVLVKSIFCNLILPVLFL